MTTRLSTTRAPVCSTSMRSTQLQQCCSLGYWFLLYILYTGNIVRRKPQLDQMTSQPWQHLQQWSPRHPCLHLQSCSLYSSTLTCNNRSTFNRPSTTHGDTRSKQLAICFLFQHSSRDRRLNLLLLHALKFDRPTPLLLMHRLRETMRRNPLARRLTALRGSSTRTSHMDSATFKLIVICVTALFGLLHILRPIGLYRFILKTVCVSCKHSAFRCQWIKHYHRTLQRWQCCWWCCCWYAA